jgi:hypothetical protein
MRNTKKMRISEKKILHASKRVRIRSSREARDHRM